MDEKVQRLVDQVAAGEDVLVRGPEDVIRRLMAEAGTALAGVGTVIPVASSGELSLSGLIAQISGKADLGGQDDAVLELGFGRLTGPGRTVLILQVPQGISRSALRYLQHVSRQAPRLSLIVQASAPLDALLEEPGFAAVRARWRVAAPVVVAVSPPATIEPPVVQDVPAPAEPPRSRRRLFWVASALGLVAAVAGVAWLGHNRLQAREGTDRTTRPLMRASSALVPVPMLAGVAEASIPLLPVAPVVLAVSAPASAELPTVVAALTPVPPVLAPTLSIPAATMVDRPPAPRRPEPARTARVRSLPGPSYLHREQARYAEQFGYDEPPPAWYRGEWRRRETPYPYGIDIYGRPIFRDNRY